MRVPVGSPILQEQMQPKEWCQSYRGPGQLVYAALATPHSTHNANAHGSLARCHGPPCAGEARKAIAEGAQQSQASLA